MAELEELLIMPRNWEARPDAWRHLTSDDTLFRAVYAAVQGGAAAKWAHLQELSAQWNRAFIAYVQDPKRRDKFLRDWRFVQCMLWCGEQAATRPESYRTEIDRVCFTLADTPESIENPAWAWVCSRTLLQVAGRRVDVPIPLWDERKGENRGFIATLVLEVLERGAQQVVPHPIDTFCTRADELFHRSLEDAWAAASRLAQHHGVNVLCDGRWRLLQGNQPIAEVSGRSAGGAAALGWYLALGGMVPDESMIVLAAVDREGILHPLQDVNGVHAKIRAIAVDGRFDTIAVVREDLQTAQAALNEAVRAGLIGNGEIEVRPIEGGSTGMPATLNALVNLRPTLVDEVMAYLEGLAQHVAQLPRFYPMRLRNAPSGKTPFDDIRQLVQVVDDRAAFERWLVEERERMHAAGYEFDRLAYDPTRARPEFDEPDAIGRQRLAPPSPVPWDDRAGQRFPRAIILGDPGFGKTWLLFYEARRLALGGAQGLRERTLNFTNLIMPIFARLPIINGSDNPVEESLVALVIVGRTEAFRRVVWEQLRTNRATVLLDGWDEVPVEVPQHGEPIKYEPRHQQRLGQRLEAFARTFPQLRLLLTSRIVGYTGSPVPGAQELELLALDPPYIEAFVRVWFGDDTTAHQFLTLFQQMPQVRGLVRIPLMLALLCRAYHENPGDFPTRRVELYERSLRGLLRDWKGEKEHRVVSDAYVDAMVELLEVAGYELFAQGHEQFTESLLREAMVPWLNGLKQAHELYGCSAAKLIAELKRDGIFISAGEYYEAPLLFLHRTFQEYLTASTIARGAYVYT